MKMPSGEGFSRLLNLVNEQGIVLDEISNRVKVAQGGYSIGQFIRRLRQGSYECGGNVGVYLSRRATEP